MTLGLKNLESLIQSFCQRLNFFQNKCLIPTGYTRQPREIKVEIKKARNLQKIHNIKVPTEERIVLNFH